MFFCYFSLFRTVSTRKVGEKRTPDTRISGVRPGVVSPLSCFTLNVRLFCFIYLDTSVATTTIIFMDILAFQVDEVVVGANTFSVGLRLTDFVFIYLSVHVYLVCYSLLDVIIFTSSFKSSQR